MKKYDYAFNQILAGCAIARGLQTEEVLAAFSLPRDMLTTYEELGRRHQDTTSSVIISDIERVGRVDYPSRDCLTPREIEEYASAENLSAEQGEHISSCIACAALLAAATPDPRRLADYLAFVVKQRSPSASDASERIEALDLSSVEARHAEASRQELDERDEMLKGETGVIGEALAAFAQTIRERKDRRRVFRMVLAKLKDRVRQPAFDREIIWEADRARLADWAVESLMSLYVPLSTTGQNALVWHYAVACVPRVYRVDLIDSLCGGIVYEVSAGPEASEVLRELATVLERLRLEVPFGSSAAMRTAVLNALSRPGTSDRTVNRAMNAARQAMESSDALLPDPDRVIDALVLLQASRSPENSPLRQILVPITALFANRLAILRAAAANRGRPDIVEAIASQWR